MTTDTIERHPWNSGFEWTMPVTAPRTISAAQFQQFDQLGYVVVDDLLDAATLDAVTDEVDALVAAADRALEQAENGRMLIAEQGAITFRSHLLPESPVLRKLSRHETILGIALDLIGPDVNVYWDQAVYKKSEKPRRFPWHQDNGYGFVEPQQYLTVWIALNEAHVNNGCPWIAPGVHRQGTLRHRFVDPLGFECFSDAPSAVAAEVPAGGAAVFSSLTPHLTGPNITGEVRKTYILQYAPAGAQRLEGDPDAGPPARVVPADDPERQYPVLRGGRPV
ncbi:MAG: phytanoyl-CoA dioxygenase family protein [Actinomycetota bacterium]|nr:phytanoyl-CoA dioxygenase family protein [Actinomycetota bacterium]